MSKRHKLSYYVDDQIHADFAAYVKARRRRPAEVLEELMRRVVSDGVTTAAAPATTPVQSAPLHDAEFRQALVAKLEAMTETDRALAEAVRRMSGPEGQPRTRPGLLMLLRRVAGTVSDRAAMATGTAVKIAYQARRVADRARRAVGYAFSRQTRPNKGAAPCSDSPKVNRA